MRHAKSLTFLTLLLTAATARADIVPILNLKSYLDAATVVAKVKVTALTALTPAPQGGLRMGGLGGPDYSVSANVLQAIKGSPLPALDFNISQHAGLLSTGPQLAIGKTYLVLINAGDPPTLLGALELNEAPVQPVFGKEPVDLLLAELADIAGKETPRPQRIAALEQLGNLRDRRPAKIVAAAADDPDITVLRAAVIAQYRMGIAPDAHKVMSVFDSSVMDVWYQESGTPQKDANGKTLMRRENGIPFMERGLPDFDYATYVREGIKLDWVRKDASTLYKFFGAPWKVQRHACVPEFIALLDDKDPLVQWWAVICLTHTVENKDGLPWDKVPPDADTYFTKWRTWWKDQGPAYMAQKPAADG